MELRTVVMAGGEGTRLRPLTINCPKPLVPVCNEPIMEHILTLLRRHGVRQVTATVHYLADEIQAYFGDGTDFGVEMAYSLETKPLGTAGAVKKIEGWLGDGTFLIVSGDSLTDCNLEKALEFHRSKGSLATLVLHRVAAPLEFGVVITDQDGRIQRFLEKPSWSEVFSDTVNTGIYILEPEVLEYIPPDEFVDWSHDVFPALLEKGMPMFGYVMEGYWTDIGSLSQYREAQEHLLAGRLDLPVRGEQVQPGVFVGPNCTISESATIVPPVCIGRNCKVKAGARVGPYTMIGDNVFVESGAILERSVVWDNAYIGPNVVLRSAIAGYRTTIKKDSVLHEDSVVGDRCLIDVGCVIRPRVKIWPDKVVERGSTVTMSLIWGSKWRGNLFRELGVAGLSNIEITPDFACRLGSAYGSILPNRSTVVTCRDSTRSSRMIKRAIISSLLSVGCNVVDLQSTALPIARHFIRNHRVAGAINVRKLPGNARVTLIELLDHRGAYLTRGTERKIESAFSREDFIRVDPDDLGTIDFGSEATDLYRADFLARLGDRVGRRRFRVVCDYGYSPLGSLYPAMLARLGAESISLNSYNDAKLAPRTEDEIARHVQNLRHIVRSLGYDMGVLFTDEGERMTVVDDHGRELESHALFAAIAWLLSRTSERPRIAMSVTAPTRVEQALREAGAEIVRTKADVRSIVSESLDADVRFAGDGRGGFIFPDFHAGFDAAFSFANLLALLQTVDCRLSDVAARLPKYEMAYVAVRCPWEHKGTVMRRISEEGHNGANVELLDGIKIVEPNAWVLVLPDAVEPVFHVYAESDAALESQELVERFARKIEQYQGLP